jgi:hypothetical protein
VLPHVSRDEDVPGAGNLRRETRVHTKVILSGRFGFPDSARRRRLGHELGVGAFRKVPSSPGWAAEREVDAAFEDAIEDDLGEVRVVQDLAPCRQALVRREDDGPLAEVALVHDAEEDVGGVVRVVEVAPPS